MDLKNSILTAVFVVVGVWSISSSRSWLSVIFWCHGLIHSQESKWHLWFEFTLATRFSVNMYHISIWQYSVVQHCQRSTCIWIFECQYSRIQASYTYKSNSHQKNFMRANILHSSWFLQWFFYQNDSSSFKMIGLKVKVFATKQNFFLLRIQVHNQILIWK